MIMQADLEVKSEQAGEEKAISGGHSRGQPLKWLFNDGYCVAAAY